MICTVCIATYKRRELLKHLLDSLLYQKLPQDTELQVIVVDNDKERTVEDLVRKYKNKANIKFEYYVQPIKNISLTRNVAVKNSKGWYLLFIDDDEVADEQWVYYHLEAIVRFNADGVFGCVFPIFHSETPDWIRKNKFYDKDSPPTGSLTDYTRTSNCIVKASILKAEEGPFEAEYGITGGEDTQLFTRLEKKGAKFISSKEAIVTEFIPPERTKVKWLFKKYYQMGNTVTRREIEFAGNKLVEKFRLLFKAITYLIISVILFILCLPYTKWRIYWLLKISSNLGRLTAIFGYYYKGYR